ncbi:CDGSH iron-sulfur domain-containing protein [uncultured Methanomethylovorans sp.]|uniref:CDGSH iron-sulfur domain-containing protein n=1 Tax=uncultured Methanomethylovorans sp. TaxID=183759 RepID=UPI002AA86805|nr:CDGSH iron-sulfur domain-containing protein [uncultured Methanomethylovorans sp.]
MRCKFFIHMCSRIVHTELLSIACHYFIYLISRYPVARIEKSIVVIEYPLRSEHGPLWIRGGIPIESADGKLYEIRNRFTLCGCGKSKNKPFCDGSHAE